MEKIQYPLKSRMKRAAVGGLHQALTRAGYKIAASEKANQRFGATTRRAVVDFQTKHGLKATGEVGRQTAVLLNTLAENPTPKMVHEKAEFVVRGAVLYPDGKPLAGALVQAYDKDLRSEELLGEQRTDPDGRYEIGYSREQFRRAEKNSADLVVRAFAPGKKAPAAESAVVFNAGPVEIVGGFVEDKQIRILNEG